MKKFFNAPMVLAAMFLTFLFFDVVLAKATTVPEPAFSEVKDAYIQPNGLWTFVYEGDQKHCKLCAARHAYGVPKISEQCVGRVGANEQCATVSKVNGELRLMLPNALTYFLPMEASFMIVDGAPVAMVSSFTMDIRGDPPID